MSRDYSRPSAWARWGWLGVAANALGVAANVLMLTAFDGGLPNWLAIVVCTSSGIFSFYVWRDEVNRDRARRFVMALRSEARR